MVESDKFVASFEPSDVTVVSLTALVVVSDALLSRKAVEQAVLEVMDARRNGLRELPNNNFDYGSVVCTSFDLASGVAFTYCMIAIYEHLL